MAASAELRIHQSVIKGKPDVRQTPAELLLAERGAVIVRIQHGIMPPDISSDGKVARIHLKSSANEDVYLYRDSTRIQVRILPHDPHDNKQVFNATQKEMIRNGWFFAYSSVDKTVAIRDVQPRQSLPSE